MEFGMYQEDEPHVIEWVQSNDSHHKQPIAVVKRLRDIEQKVNKIQTDLLEEELRKTSSNIVEFIDMDEEQRTVFFVNFSKGQAHDLQKFVKILDNQCLSKWKSNEKTTLIKINEDDIMGILLKIYIHIEEGDGSHKIFLIQRITNFDYKDIPILERSLDKGHYSIVIPTYKSLIQIDTLNYEGFFHFNLYNHKQLFLQFMMKVVMQPTIKAYFRPQILELISDLDYYPISYREAVRRFTVSLKRLHIALDKYNIKFAPVQFKNLYNSLVQVLKSCVPNGNVKIDDRFIKTVLDKDYIFKIPQSMVDMVVINEEFQEGSIDSSNLDRIARKLKKKLESDNSLSKYAKQINKPQQKTDSKNQIKATNNISKNKLDRMNMLQIPKPVSSKHDILNQQITKIIKQATQKIRNQALKVQWSQISFNEYCRPQLAKQVVKDIEKDLKVCQVFLPIQKFVQIQHRDNYSFSQLDIADYHYVMTELQYLGFIQNTKKQIEPSFINQFYKKANYSIKS